MFKSTPEVLVSTRGGKKGKKTLVTPRGKKTLFTAKGLVGYRVKFDENTPDSPSSDQESTTNDRYRSRKSRANLESCMSSDSEDELPSDEGSHSEYGSSEEDSEFEDDGFFNMGCMDGLFFKAPKKELKEPKVFDKEMPLANELNFSLQNFNCKGSAKKCGPGLDEEINDFEMNAEELIPESARQHFFQSLMSVSEGSSEDCEGTDAFPVPSGARPMSHEINEQYPSPPAQLVHPSQFNTNLRQPQDYPAIEALPSQIVVQEAPSYAAESCITNPNFEMMISVGDQSNRVSSTMAMANTTSRSSQHINHPRHQLGLALGNPAANYVSALLSEESDDSEETNPSLVESTYLDESTDQSGKENGGNPAAKIDPILSPRKGVGNAHRPSTINERSRMNNNKARIKHVEAQKNPINSSHENFAATWGKLKAIDPMGMAADETMFDETPIDDKQDFVYSPRNHLKNPTERIAEGMKAPIDSPRKNFNFANQRTSAISNDRVENAADKTKIDGVSTEANNTPRKNYGGAQASFIAKRRVEMTADKTDYDYSGYKIEPSPQPQRSDQTDTFVHSAKIGSSPRTIAPAVNVALNHHPNVNNATRKPWVSDSNIPSMDEGPSFDCGPPPKQTTKIETHHVPKAPIRQSPKVLAAKALAAKVLSEDNGRSINSSTQRVRAFTMSTSSPKNGLETQGHRANASPKSSTSSNPTSPNSWKFDRSSVQTRGVLPLDNPRTLNDNEFAGSAVIQQRSPTVQHRMISPNNASHRRNVISTQKKFHFNDPSQAEKDVSEKAQKRFNFYSPKSAKIVDLSYGQKIQNTQGATAQPPKSPPSPASELSPLNKRLPSPVCINRNPINLRHTTISSETATSPPEQEGTEKNPIPSSEKGIAGIEYLSSSGEDFSGDELMGNLNRGKVISKDTSRPMHRSRIPRVSHQNYSGGMKQSSRDNQSPSDQVARNLKSVGNKTTEKKEPNVEELASAITSLILKDPTANRELFEALSSANNRNPNRPLQTSKVKKGQSNGTSGESSQAEMLTMKAISSLFLKDPASIEGLFDALSQSDNDRKETVKSPKRTAGRRLAPKKPVAAFSHDFIASPRGSNPTNSQFGYPAEPWRAATQKSRVYDANPQQRLPVSRSNGGGMSASPTLAGKDVIPLGELLDALSGKNQRTTSENAESPSLDDETVYTSATQHTHYTATTQGTAFFDANMYT